MNAKDSSWTNRAAQVAAEVLAKHADVVDAAGRWPKESVAALTEAGLLGLTVPLQQGGAGEGPAVFSQVTAALAEKCASTAMIYLMHVCGTQVIAASKEFPGREGALQDIVKKGHLSTLAFSEKGSRSHFWAPISQATASGDKHRIVAEKSWVTSAGQADSYIVSARAVGRSEPTASTLYFVPKTTPGLTINSPWNGLGLRGNASAAMHLDISVPAANHVSAEGDGFAVMLSTVLPWFQLGNASVCLGIARAATAGTRQHLLSSKFEHLGQPLSSLMNLRARLAKMQIIVDTQAAFLASVAKQMENPGPATMLAVLESKAAAAEAALEVTDLAMRACGGAAFSRHLTVERNFRDARAGSVMAPTTDVLYDFIGKALLDIPLF